jgi:hypothetical protein
MLDGFIIYDCLFRNYRYSKTPPWEKNGKKTFFSPPLLTGQFYLKTGNSCVMCNIFKWLNEGGCSKKHLIAVIISRFAPEPAIRFAATLANVYGDAENRVLNRVGGKLILNMKRIFLLMGLSGIITLQGVAQEQRAKLSAKLKVANTKSIAHTRVISQVFERVGAQAGISRAITGLPPIKQQDFDFVNLYQGSVLDGKVEAIVAPYKGKNRAEKIAFVLFRSNGKYGRPMLIKATADRSQLTYYDLEAGTMLKMQKEGNSFSFSSSSIEPDGGGARRSGCGQAVMDCVTDAYSNRGWASVWATFQSIFIPATGAAIIAACIADNCL